MDEIIKRISAFERECKRGDYTDSGDVWDLLYWIKKAAKRRQKFGADVNKLLEYNWADELEDYTVECGCGADDNQRRGHIFETMVRLDNFLSGTDKTSARWAAEMEGKG